MAITSIKTGSSFTNLVKYDNFLGPNSAYVPPAFESIATATGTGSSGTITFSSIPATYKHLQIRYIARTDAAFSNDFITFRFNSDTATNYAYHLLAGDGASASASGGASSNIMYGSEITGASATAAIMGTGIIDVIDYASTSKAKTTRIIGGDDRNGAGEIRLSSDLWTSTSAINTITITSFRSANWTTSSTFALYGIKG
jgi:hypothetical protein